MKKIFICIMIMCFLSIANISAAKININDSYDQGEVLIAKVTGDFKETLSKDNINLYKDKDYYERSSLNIKELIKIDNNYFFYTSSDSLSKPSGNYSLKIEDIFYQDLGNIINDDLIEDFKITNKTADFSINPGVIYTNNDFKIELLNLKNYNLEIELIENLTEKQTSWFGSDTENKENINLNARDKKEIDFNINNLTNISENYYEIQLKSENTNYKIPIYIYEKQDKYEENTNYLEFNINNLDIFVLINSSLNRTIKLKNTGKIELKNIKLNLSKELELVSLSKYNIDSLKPNSSEEIIIYINSTNMTEKEIHGEITAISENGSRENIKINLNYTKNFVPYEETDKYNDSKVKINLDKTCEELNGSICEGECLGEIKNLEEGSCCIGECLKKEKENNIMQKIIGYFLLLCIIIFVLWFFIKRFKHTQRKTNLLETAKKGLFSKKKD